MTIYDAPSAARLESPGATAKARSARSASSAAGA